MGKIIESPLSDEELRKRNITIPKEETETAFFDWFDQMEEEVFGKDKEWQAMHKKK